MLLDKRMDAQQQRLVECRKAAVASVAAVAVPLAAAGTVTVLERAAAVGIVVVVAAGIVVAAVVDGVGIRLSLLHPPSPPPLECARPQRASGRCRSSRASVAEHSLALVGSQCLGSAWTAMASQSLQTMPSERHQTSHYLYLRHQSLRLEARSHRLDHDHDLENRHDLGHPPHRLSAHQLDDNISK